MQGRCVVPASCASHTAGWPEHGGVCIRPCALAAVVRPSSDDHGPMGCDDDGCV